MVDMKKVGQYICELRKKKGLTQNQIGERLNISPQAISKWERGESLPDTVLLIDLAFILETTVDNILHGKDMILELNYHKKISVSDVRNGINQLANLGNLIGKDNTVYQGLMNGVNTSMKLDLEECLNDAYKKEAIISEIIVQNIQNGVYVDLSDIKSNLEYEHWIKVVSDYAFKHGIC